MALLSESEKDLLVKAANELRSCGSESSDSRLCYLSELADALMDIIPDDTEGDGDDFNGLVRLAGVGRVWFTPSTDVDDQWCYTAETGPPNVVTLKVELQRFEPPARPVFWTCTVGLETLYGDGDSDHGCAATAPTPQEAANRAMAGISGALTPDFLVPDHVPIAEDSDA